MSPTEAATLLIAMAALITSAVSAFEMMRQSKNAVRPALVVLEKPSEAKNGGRGLSLYLVNMGNAVAININIVRSNLDQLEFDSEGESPIRPERSHRSEIAAGRRSLLVNGYAKSVVGDVGLYVTYQDVNGTTYYTLFSSGETTHSFGRVQAFPPRPARERVSAAMVVRRVSDAA